MSADLGHMGLGHKASFVPEAKGEQGVIFVGFYFS